MTNEIPSNLGVLRHQRDYLINTNINELLILIMTIFKSILYVSLIFIAVSCSQSSTTVESSAGDLTRTTIVFPSINTGKASEILDSIAFIPIYESEDALISNISKLMIVDNHIFILDRFAKNTLAEFDENGEFIRHYGNKGESGSEYRRAWDFDVDANGVYIYDMHGHKLMNFTRTGELVGTRKISNRLQGFAKLTNGYVLGLAKDEDNTATELVVTDSLMKPIQTYLPFRNSFKDDRMIDNLFRRNDSIIIYNRPINNLVYIIDNNGTIGKELKITFNDSDIPENLKDSYEIFIKEKGKEKYNYAYVSPLYDGNYITCPVFINGQKGTAIYDIHNNYFYVKEMNPIKDKINLSDIILPMAYSNKRIYTILEQPIVEVLADKNTIPTEITSHLDDGNKVLCIYYLK